MIFNKMQTGDFEQVVFCQDSGTGLRGIIAMHSTSLGPAVGGCRMWNYASEQEALEDALRLSMGMTYKAAISGLNWGGGKSVIYGDPKTQKTPALLLKFGEFVNRLGGTYITAKDVGISSDDLRQMKKGTPHVLGIDGEKNSSGDPSPATAWGVYHGMKSAAQKAFGSSNLKGLKVAVQGLGSVAYSLIGHLHKEGAVVIGCDIEPAAIERSKKSYSIEVVSPEQIFDVACDVFAPCALGLAINSKTLPRLKAKVIAGAANNQLESDQMGHEILARKMVYAPDYAINAGGLINIYHEIPAQGGYNQARAFDHVTKIGSTITEILKRSDAENLPTHQIANRMAEERFKKKR